MKLPKKVVAMQKVAQAEGSPFPEVLVEGSRAGATDGKMLVVCDIRDPLEEMKAGVTYSVPAALIDEGKDRVAKGKSPDAGYFEVSVKDCPVFHHKLSLDEMVGQAMRLQVGEPKAVVSFDLDRLIALAKVLYAGEPATSLKVVKVTVYADPKAALTIETVRADCKATALLAPCVTK